MSPLLPLSPVTVLTSDTTPKVSKPSNTKSIFGAECSRSLTSNKVLKAQSVSPIPESRKTEYCVSREALKTGCTYTVHPTHEDQRTIKRSKYLSSRQRCAHGIRYFLQVEKFDMYRGRERRCFQPLIIFCPLTSADLSKSPTRVK